MNLAAEILVVILSVFLTIFLIVGIVLVIYLIKLTRQIRKISLSAGKTAEDIESIVSRIVQVTSPLFLAQIVGKLLKFFKKSKKEK